MRGLGAPIGGKNLHRATAGFGRDPDDDNATGPDQIIVRHHLHIGVKQNVPRAALLAKVAASQCQVLCRFVFAVAKVLRKVWAVNFQADGIAGALQTSQRLHRPKAH